MFNWVGKKALEMGPLLTHWGDRNEEDFNWMSGIPTID